MKRIICVLVTLLTFAGFNAYAVQIDLDITSISGDVGTTVSVPIYVQLPNQNLPIDYSQGSFVFADPSVAKFVNVSAAPQMGANVINPNLIVFANSNPVYPINGLIIIIEVQITSSGCTDIIFSDYDPVAGPIVPAEFFTGGTLFENNGVDIIVNGGEICSNCNSFIQEVGIEISNNTPYFLNQTGHALSNYADYTSTCITDEHLDVTQQLALVLSQGNLYVAVYLDNDANGSFETLYSIGNPNASSFNFGISAGDINPGAGMRVIVSNQPISNPTDIPSCGEVEDYVFCDGCSCDPNDLILGPITVSQLDPDDCDFHLINVPPVLGCSDSEVSHNYNFKFFKPNGLVLPPEMGINTTLDGTFYSFPGTGEYIVVVTYTMTDDSGCTHEVGPIYQSYNYTGCDCSILPAPANLNCVYTQGKSFQTLNWNPVQNAVSYEIQIVKNDPACCSQGSGNVSTEIKTSTNTSITRPKFDCFSWRVRAVCSNGSKSEWSESECSCGVLNPSGGGPGLTGGGGAKSAQVDLQEESDQEFKITAVPNPANNHVQITLSSNLEMSLNGTEVIIHDISGKTIYRSTISSDETKTVDLSSFTPGMYVIKIVDNDTTLSTEKLIVQ